MTMLLMFLLAYYILEQVKFEGSERGPIRIE